jgi:hypothetical protein
MRGGHQRHHESEGSFHLESGSLVSLSSRQIGEAGIALSRRYLPTMPPRIMRPSRLLGAPTGFALVSLDAAGSSPCDR